MIRVEKNKTKKKSYQKLKGRKIVRRGQDNFN